MSILNARNIAMSISLPVLILMLVSSCSSNIHRASLRTSKPPSETVMNYQNVTSLHENKEQRLFAAQLFSVLASLAVGVTGILPLIIIPLEAGPGLKHGAGARRLRLLLSFAVGGLLGDVFLHLLPESWKHLANEDESAHRTMGFWVLAGIFTFIIIEMIFTNCQSEEEEEETEQNGDVLCREENDNYIDSNGQTILRKRKLSLKSTSTKLTNGNANHSHEGKSVKSAKIDISGYLNLFANMMDNFTHGLAISASFLNSTRVGLLTTFAILIHEVPHEVGDFAILLKSGFDRWGAAKAQMITAFFGLCGALTALYVESAEEIGTKTAFLLPFTAGGFIQIALVSVLPEVLRESNSKEALYQVISISAGVSCMAAVTFMTE